MKTQRLFCTVLLALAVLTVGAQERISCMRDIPLGGAKTRGFLGYPNQDWDPQRIYRQLVVLITFSDFDFSVDDPQAYYHRLLNEPGFNEGYGMGSVADYFRDQSGGRFNLQFDVYGPVKVNQKAKSGDGRYYYGEGVMEDAFKSLAATVDIDYSLYDWDGDGNPDQILFIAAGFCGNHVKGYIWPNTGYFGTVSKVHFDMSSICCELWADSTSCGIGTICHEFSHCLGLPDIYPTSSSDFSAVDEWDLMDGGNYTNKGWCPPNYSAMEKMALGWGDPIELTDATTITGMKPVSEGGETYIIRNSGNENEYYILENRCQTNWDYGIPGQGLAIFHVDYDREIWSNNNVNSSPSHYRYDLFHADGKDYKSWDPANNGLDMTKYTMDRWMRNRYLSTSVYPYADSTAVNESLTDNSDPKAMVYTANADGIKLMSKSITNIRVADDGTISFDFMGGGTAIRGVKSVEVKSEQWYDLQGRRLPDRPQRKGLYIHNGQKESIR